MYDDGDLGVYKHEGIATTASIQSNYTSYNTSAGGKKIGEIQFWDEFAKHDLRGNVLSKDGINYANPEASYLRKRSN